MNTPISKLQFVRTFINNIKENLDFYENILSLNLKSKRKIENLTHISYGEGLELGGTILDFIFRENALEKPIQINLIPQIAFEISEESYIFWVKRLASFNISFKEEISFNKKIISFQDFEGNPLSLVVDNNETDGRIYNNYRIPSTMGIKGFHNIALIATKISPIARILCGILDYRLIDIDKNKYRFINTTNNSFIDIILDENLNQENFANYSIGLYVENIAVLQEKIQTAGLQYTSNSNDFFQTLFLPIIDGINFEFTIIPNDITDYSTNMSKSKTLNLSIQ